MAAKNTTSNNDISLEQLDQKIQTKIKNLANLAEQKLSIPQHITIAAALQAHSENSKFTELLDNAQGILSYINEHENFSATAAEQLITEPIKYSDIWRQIDEVREQFIKQSQNNSPTPSDVLTKYCAKLRNVADNFAQETLEKSNLSNLGLIITNALKKDICRRIYVTSHMPPPEEIYYQKDYKQENVNNAADAVRRFDEVKSLLIEAAEQDEILHSIFLPADNETISGHLSIQNYLQEILKEHNISDDMAADIAKSVALGIKNRFGNLQTPKIYEAHLSYIGHQYGKLIQQQHQQNHTQEVYLLTQELQNNIMLCLLEPPRKEMQQQEQTRKETTTNKKGSQRKDDHASNKTQKQPAEGANIEKLRLNDSTKAAALGSVMLMGGAVVRGITANRSNDEYEKSGKRKARSRISKIVFGAVSVVGLLLFADGVLNRGQGFRKFSDMVRSSRLNNSSLGR